MGLMKGQTQIPLSDAIKLKAFIDNGTKVFETGNAVAVQNIVTNYANGLSIKAIYLTNPFLKQYCAKLVPGTAGALVGSNVEAPAKNVNTGSILIDAIARFIVDRIKKELQAAFFERLYTLIKKDEYQDCRTLFPNTYKTLLAAGNQIYNYEIYLTSLRDAFGRDLEVILPNLESVIRDGRFAPFFTAHKELRSVCLSALFIAKGIKNGDHFGTILEKYDPTDPDYIAAGENDGENFSLVNTIKLVQEISKSFKNDNPGSSRYWADRATISNLKDPIILDLYLGLLYERVKNITIGNGAGENYGTLLGVAKNRFDQLRELVNNVSNNIEECEQKFSNLTANESIENYLSYFNSISNLLNGIRSSEPFKNLKSFGLSDVTQDKIDKAWILLDKINFVLDNFTSIYAHLKDKKYSLVLVDIRNIYEQRFSLDKLNPANADKKKKIEAVFDFLFEYGTALAEIVEAKDSKEVYAAIDRIAAPVGSSRVKKENAFSFALNAYGGAFIGKEKIEGVKDDSKANNYGISAPVGFSFSFGKIKGAKAKPETGYKSVTIFLSVIDVGAPVSFRFQNDTLNEIPTISWKDIIAPGVHLIYGFGKMPLSLAVGWQTGPNLRKVTSQYNEYQNSKYSRLSIGLYVDIPVFIFYRRKYW
jgi:hypothetical protein